MTKIEVTLTFEYDIYEDVSDWDIEDIEKITTLEEAEEVVYCTLESSNPREFTLTSKYID